MPVSRAMKDARISLALCPLLLTGCARQLTQHAAGSVVEAALAQRQTSGMPTLTQGSIDLQVGDIHGTAAADHNCRSQSLELADLQRYDSAHVIHLDRPEPCKWVVTLSPQTLRDVAYDDTFKPPSLRDYNTVSIALSQWQGFEIIAVDQSGMHADVDAEFRYRYTNTMRQLSRSDIFPQLKAGCSYDNRNSLIACKRKLPMTFVDGAWRLDAAVLS